MHANASLIFRNYMLVGNKLAGPFQFRLKSDYRSLENSQSRQHQGMVHHTSVYTVCIQYTLLGIIYAYLSFIIYAYYVADKAITHCYLPRLIRGLSILV